MSEWFSVKERLPDKDDWYIINVPTETPTVQCDEWTGGKQGEFMRWDNLLVTHWQPLPEPPKEGA